MSADIPFSRPVDLRRAAFDGRPLRIEATPEECARLAAEFGLPAIGSVRAEFRLSGRPSKVHVSGRVTADVTQVCVVTLDPFESTIEEEVEVDFREHDPRRTDLELPETAEGHETDLDRPDEIVDGRIDLGLLSAEFVALGLDPYPRKPGVSFEPGTEGDAEDSPFAALLRPRGT